MMGIAELALHNLYMIFILCLYYHFYFCKQEIIPDISLRVTSLGCLSDLGNAFLWCCS